MKPTKHTPGPWFVKVNPNTKAGVPFADISDRTDGGINVAHVTNAKWTEKEMAANAALIAAAPEMLEALKDLVNYAIGELSQEQVEKLDPQFKAATLVIFKAEGK